MANSFGTLSVAVLALRVMAGIKKRFPQLALVATDLSDGQADFGQPIIAKVVTVPTVSDYHATNGYVPGDAATVDVPVTIDKHKHVSLSFGEQEMSGTKRNLVDEQVDAAAYALGRQVLVDLGALITVANFPVAQETVKTVANSDRAALTAMRKVLGTRGAPPIGRYALVNSDVFEVMSNDAKITSSDYVGENKPDMVGGVLRNVSGFEQVVEWPEMPTGESLTGFAATKDALVVASRIPKDPALLVKGLNIPGTIEVFTDAATGMSLMGRYFYDMKLGKLQLTLTWMYGVAKGVANHGQRLVTAANV
ncbi:MAG: hypothetical protein B9S32_13890 [Verrucomicrobia bacterium Tous-C9LFEB]|nr:MAG: hypothetical protein B9S32_13890 [Verrucomicrobia bacterium Tous-C9LFEB]